MADTQSTLYIPPEGIYFRIVGLGSQCALVSRTTSEPQVNHVPVTQGVTDDQWFTLVPGTGDRAGKYAIKGRQSGCFLFSRSQPSTLVGHTSPSGGAGLLDENYFVLQLGTGQRVGWFRLVTPSNKLTVVSRTHMSPQFTNWGSENTLYDDQFFRFLLEELEVERVEYHLGQGKILSSTSEVIKSETIQNNSSETRMMPYNYDSEQTHSASWDYDTGLPMAAGIRLGGGIPIINYDEFDLDTLVAQQFTYGEPNNFTAKLARTFTIKAGPGKTYKVETTVEKGTIEVPYTVHLKSKSSGVCTQTTGKWRGASTWNLKDSVSVVKN